MIQSFTLYTDEIDAPELARSEIAKQAAALALKKHTVGLLVCHYDYINGGIVQALSQELAFPLIGITSFYQSTPRAQGLFELTITVLTSDDVCFSIASSGDVSNDDDSAEVVHDTCSRALGEQKQPPDLILSFLAVRRPISGDEFLRRLDRWSGGAPCFGAVTVTEDEAGNNAYLVCGDTITESGFTLLFMTGNIHAEHYVCSYREEKMLDIMATVTEANGAWVRRLNGEPALAFLRKNGLQLRDEDQDRVCNVPFFCKQPGELFYLGRTLGAYDDAKGLYFYGELPEGSMLRIGTASMEETVAVSTDIVRRAAAENPEAALMLIFSCIGRYITLGLDPTQEMDKTTGLIPQTANYLACYVGGEICPVPLFEGPVNRYHNISYVVCVLR